jgi:inorganic triphosphatase YgiF
MGKLMRKGNRGGTGRSTANAPVRVPEKRLGVGKGRKIKYTYEEVKAALTETRGMVTYAAKRLGTTWDTLSKYIKENPKLDRHILSLQERRLDYAESKLDLLIGKEDKTAIIFFLKTKGKKRGYVEDEKVDLSKLAQPITFIYQPPPPQED